MSEKKPALWLRIYSVIVYGFIYAPILILIVFSFNSQKLNIHWEGFTLNWYKVLFNDSQILLATRNTLMIAIISTLIATIIGTMAALAMYRYRFPLYNYSETVMYIPIVIPEVVMGISLLVFFVMINFTLGLTTITLSHIAFSIPFVALVVRARLHGYDKAIDEAAMDAGRVGGRHVGVDSLAGRLCHYILHCRTRLHDFTPPCVLHGENGSYPRN
jgi:spermidine/putrescine transport system permease protein